MIELDKAEPSVSCKRCQQSTGPFTELGVCRRCTEITLIKMHCPECNYVWTAPGLVAWCPLCRNVKVTTGDKAADDWMWENEATKNGIVYCGMLKGYDDKKASPLFQDNRTGSFSPGENETVAQALERKRKQFADGERRNAENAGC